MRRLPMIILILVTTVVTGMVMLSEPIPLAQQAQPDTGEYADSANRLAHGLGYTTVVPDLPTHPHGPNPPRYPMGYPLLLAPFSLAGQYPANVQFGARIIAAGLVVVIAIAAFVLGGAWAAVVAVLLTALSPFIHVSGQIVMSDALSATLAVALMPLVAGEGRKAAYAAGLLAGYGVLVRLSFLTVVIALLLALSGTNRIRAAAGAIPGVAAGAIYQWVAFGAPWRTGYDYWLPNLKTFALHNIRSTTLAGDGPYIFPDQLQGTITAWACHPACGLGEAMRSLPNWSFYPLVLLGLFWVFAPPLVTILGLAAAALSWRSPLGRLVLIVLVSQYLLFLPYFYQGARFMAPATFMLVVLSAVVLPRIVRQVASGGQRTWLVSTFRAPA